MWRDVLTRAVRRFGMVPKHGTSIDDVLRGIHRGDFDRPSKGDAMSLAIVARCIRLIADTIAALPFEVENVARGRVRADLNILNRRPNPNWSSVNLWERAIEDALLDGVGVVGMVRTFAGDLQALHYLPNVTPLQTPDRRQVLGYRDRYNTVWPHEDVIVFTNDEFDGVRSPGLLDRGVGKAAAILLAYQRYTQTELSRGFMHNLVLKMAGRPTKEALDQLKADIRFTEAQGLDGQAFPFVIGSQVDDVKPFPKNPRDLQMVQDIMLRERQVAVGCGVHPVLAGLESRGQTWGGTVRALLHGFKVFTLNSHAVRFNAELGWKLYPEIPDAKAGFPLDELDRGDAGERAERYERELAGHPWRWPSQIARAENPNLSPDEIAEAKRLDDLMVASMGRGGSIAPGNRPAE